MTRRATPADLELRDAGLLELLDYVAPLAHGEVRREDVKRDVERVLAVLEDGWTLDADVADIAGLPLERTVAILEALLNHVGDVDRDGARWRLLGGHAR